MQEECEYLEQKIFGRSLGGWPVTGWNIGKLRRVALFLGHPYEGPHCGGCIYFLEFDAILTEMGLTADQVEKVRARMQEVKDGEPK